MLNLDTEDLGIYHNGEVECLGLCQLARLHAQQVGKTLSTIPVIEFSETFFQHSTLDNIKTNRNGDLACGHE